MSAFVFQFFNLILIIVLLGAPVIITVLLIRHFGKPKDSLQYEDYLIEKIRELERRIEELENK
ncbi:MAG: hypothetical protein JJT76_13185 [Clostridiaceae bacterium]|nr:hypothetical protein [Clostridiaceae bacterium]